MAGRVEAGVGLHTRGPKLRSGRSVPGTRRDPVTGDNGRSAQHAGSLLVNAAQRQSVAGGGRLRPHLRLRLLLSWRSQHIVPTESTTYRFSPAAASYTVDRGANPLWARSENGFVPHFAWGSRNGPFPGSPVCPATQTPGHSFWLRSVIVARRPVPARDCRQVSCSPAQKCRFP